MNKLSRFLAAVFLALATPSLAVERASIPGEIVVDAGSTIQGVAGTGTAITYSIFGTEISSSNIETYKRLGSAGQLPTSTGTLYTAPATAPADVASITLTNTTGSDVTGVKIFIGGSAASNQLTGSITVPANGSCVVGDSGGAAKCFTPLGATLQTGGISGSGTSPDLAAFSASATIGNFSPPGPACSNQVQTNQTATGAPVCTTLTKAFLPATTVSTDQANTYSTGAQDFSSATAVTLPNGTIVLGSLLDTAIVAPGTPASGKASIYVDSTSKNIAAKNDLGTINHGVQTSAAVASNFVTAIADNGAVTKAQPDFTNLSGIIACAQQSAVTGDITSSSGTCAEAFRSFTGNSVLGRAASSSGTPTEISAGADNTLLSRLASVVGFNAMTDALHGALGGGSDHATATSTVAGFESASNKVQADGAYLDVIADYGAFGDAVTVFDCVTTVSGTTVTCATSAPFTSTAVDGGKRIAIRGAGAAGIMYVGAISTITDTSHAVVSPATTLAVSAAGTTFGHDDTTALTNAINAQQATYANSCVYLPKAPTGRFLISSALPTMTKQPCIRGQGGFTNADAGDYSKIGGSSIVWNGTSNGTQGVLDFAPVAGASNQAIAGAQLRDFWIDGRNVDQNEALACFTAKSIHGGFFENIGCIDALIGFDSYVVATLGEARDMTRFQMNKVNFRILDGTFATAGATTFSGTGTFGTGSQSMAITSGTNMNTPGYFWGMSAADGPILVNCTGGGGTTTLTGCTSRAEDVVDTPTWVATANMVQATPNNGPAFLFGGDTGANTCCGTIVQATVLHGSSWGPAAFEFKNSDSLEIFNAVINGGSATNDGATNRPRKPGVRFNGATNTLLAARNNHFWGGSPGAGGVDSMGVNNAGTVLAGPAYNNYWHGRQTGNGEPLSVSENGAPFWDLDLNGWLPRGCIQSLTAATGALTAADTLVFSQQIPPSEMQIGTTTRQEFAGQYAGSVTQQVTFRVRMGTGNAITDTLLASVVTAAGGTATVGFKGAAICTWRTASTALCELEVKGIPASAFVLTNTTAAVTITAPASVNFLSLTAGPAATTANVTFQVGETCVDKP